MGNANANVSMTSNNFVGVKFETMIQKTQIPTEKQERVKIFERGLIGDKLVLASKGIFDDRVEELCKWIETKNGKIQHIDLYDNSLTSKGAGKLFSFLTSTSSTVKIINLYKNEIDDDCMVLLCDYLEQNEMIETLWMGKNYITDKGLDLLIPSLIGNETLKHLDFYGNKGITMKSLPLLIDLAKQSCLQQILVYDTSISKSAAAQIEIYLEIPSQERELPIKSSSKSAAKRS